MNKTYIEDESLAELISSVKGFCYITSNEVDIEQRISNIVKNAIPKIKDLLGLKTTETFNFLQRTTSQEEGHEQELDLLCNYCFYKWNNQPTKIFEENYKADIIRLRAKQEVKSLNAKKV